MSSLFASLRPVLNKVSHIAFALVLASYALMSFTKKVDASLLRNLQIIAWATFAVVCMLESLMTNKSKYAFLYRIISMGTAVASIGILFATIKWEGYKNLLLVGISTTLPFALLLLFLVRNANDVVLKGLVIGGLAAYLARGFLM